MDDWKRIETPAGEPIPGATPTPDDAYPEKPARRLARRGKSPRTDKKKNGGAAVPVTDMAEGAEPTGTEVPEPGAADKPSARTDKNGYRRGAHAYAAPLGCVLILLAIAGIVFLGILGVQVIQYATDDTALRTELFDFLEPVVQYQPAAFTNVNDTDQNALTMAAIYRITEAERIRQLKEKTYENLYPLDELGRMVVPVSEVNASYAYLFGPDAVPRHRTMGGEPGMSMTFEYDEAAGCYYVPMYSSSSMYEGVLDELKEKGNTVQVRIGYVPVADIDIDDKGNPLPARSEQAEYFQTFTVQQTETGWMVIAASDREAP